MGLSLKEIALALRGQKCGRQVLAPGPGHSAHDRSLSVRISDTSRDGFVVFSHAGDHWRVCRDHVAAALGLLPDRWRRVEPQSPAELRKREEARRHSISRELAGVERLRRRAAAIWREARHPAGTVVELYLRSRGLDLPEEITGSTLRFHPACPWGQGTAAAMVGAIRSVNTGEIVGVHRTALDHAGRKLGRRVLGSTTAAAIMLDPTADRASGLTVGEGIETCLAARQLGLGPVWSLISVGNIGTLPVLPNISALTVLAEIDTAPGHPSATACQKVGTRWRAAGRTVDIIIPRIGKDLNDALRGGPTA